MIDIIEGKDGKLVVRWTISADHTGDVFGVPATGKTVIFSGHDILQIRDGKFAELWHIEQLFQLNAQLAPDLVCPL
ncbi:MAG: ester cyclase [Deltaproteobacteria bacterium]|nr:ester cyclase [Deltaproteobacteria bacterium]MBW2394987.1 ester cyclase [Deltaproteobacteria bacterium]